jgi:polar amino acid transport system substrate-binding protein
MRILPLAFALFTLPLFAENLILTTEESPPFNMTISGKITGAATDAVEEISKRSGVGIKISMLPWERAYDMAQKDPNTCVYSTTRTPAREAIFKWVGPLVANKWVLYAKADAKPVGSIEETKSAKIAGYRGDAIANFLKEGGYKVEETTNDSQNPEKLVAGRVDYWATTEVRGALLVKEKKITGIKPILTFKEVQLYLACGKSVADDTIKKMNDAVAAMTSDGTLAKFVKK